MTRGMQGSVETVGGQNAPEGFDLKGKTAVVTGATSGLGREIAEQLAGLGANVILACRNTDAARDIASDIRRTVKSASISVGPKLDLSSTSGVRTFVQEYEKEGHPLHLLVNNAGANFMPEAYTIEGVPQIIQVNYLGPYLLTRLFEPTLIASAPSRIVNLSSVMHRYGVITSAKDFLFQRKRRIGGDYSAAKLGNALFTLEHQRRLGHLGVQSCAIDPGAVATSIYKGSIIFSRPPASWVMRMLYAPPQDGARIVIDALRAPWPRPALPKAEGTSGESIARAASLQGGPERLASPGTNPEQDLLTPGLLGFARTLVWAATTLPLSLVDWPIRSLSKGRLLGETGPVPAMQRAYDGKLAAELWVESAKAVGVPEEPLLSRITEKKPIP